MPNLLDLTQSHRPLADSVFESLRDAIIYGRLEAGQWLRQEALAQELGVSQMPVREALNRLVAEGLAVRVPYKGVRVVTLSINDLEDIYDTRALLEGFAMELAAGRISAEDLARMRDLLPHTVVNADPASTEPAREANREFHWIAIRASERKQLNCILARLWDLVDPLLVYSRFWADSDKEERYLRGARNDLRSHTLILEALRAGDGQRAKEFIAQHVQSALRNLRNEMDQRDPVTTELAE